MIKKYRYQFPIVWELFKWGITIAIRYPMMRIRPPIVRNSEDSQFFSLSMLDDPED